MSHALVRFENAAGVTAQEWQAFCAEHEIVHEGRDLWLLGGRAGIKCEFGLAHLSDERSVTQVLFTTTWGGVQPARMAELARAFWVRFGGSMWADEQTRGLICQQGEPRF